MRRRGRTEEVPFDAHGLPPAEEIRLFRQSPSSHAALTQKENFSNLRQALTDLPEAQAADPGAARAGGTDVRRDRACG